MEQLAQDLWIFNGPEIAFLGLKIPTRMTIIRTGAELWVHSPTPITEQVQAFIGSHGTVTQVIAPNHLHHLYLPDWQQRYPDATFYAAPGLPEKRSDLRFDHVLAPNAHYPWSDAIAHDHFVGNRTLEEVVFFHRASRTLILTDLIINLRTSHFNRFQKLLAHLDGIAYPNGKTPRMFRWNMREREPARRGYQQMLDWQPSRIVICHGECLLENGTAEVRKRLGWIAKH